MPTWVAGVDGCRNGWIAALAPTQAPWDIAIQVVDDLEAVLDAPEQPAVVAVDIPIGLPERIDGPGRRPDQAVRRLLGPRGSSVFSMPSRAAVAAPGYREACAIARATSTPARAISKQGFMILPKVRAVDRLLQRRPELIPRVHEVHPELAFWSLNGEQPLPLPKKARGRPHEPGLALRRDLLRRAGLPAEAVEAPPPRGAAPDDLIDALAALVAALRIADGRGRSFPQPPDLDAHGIPVAIWTFEAP